MKKIIFSLVILLNLFPGKIQAASASLTGTKTVRAGDTISVSFIVNGSNISGIQAEITYDKDLLTFKSYSSKLGKNWANDRHATTGKITIVANDKTGSHPLKKATVATVTFKVNSKAEVGSNINIKVSGKTVNASTLATESFSATYTKKVAAPLSGNNNLKSLSIKNATLSPAFSPNTTTYSVSVDYAIKKLSITAVAADSSAKVHVANNSLKAGQTTNVKVTVTAASGAKKTYIIKAKRGHDPNYVPAGDNYLSSLKVGEALISPNFTKERQDYIVYVPYEVDKLTIQASPQDKRAEVNIEEYEVLSVGNNTVTITCLAENGEPRSYTLNVVKAPDYGRKNEGALASGNETVLAAMKAQREAKTQKHTFWLDLATTANKQVSAEVFTSLQEFTNAALVIDLGKAQILYYSKNLGKVETLPYDYNLTIPAFTLASELANDDPRLADGTFSFRLGQVFAEYPAVGQLSLSTGLTSGDNYFVYYYDDKVACWVLIAKNVKVDEFGNLRFDFSIASEYWITKEQLANCQSADKVEDQSSKLLPGFFTGEHDYLFWGTIGGSVLFILVLGITIGYLYERGRFRKYIKRRLESDE